MGAAPACRDVRHLRVSAAGHVRVQGAERTVYPFEELVTYEFGLDEVEAAMRTSMRPESMKVAVVPGLLGTAGGARSGHGPAAIAGQDRAIDIAGIVAEQPGDDGSQLFRQCDPQPDSTHQRPDTLHSEL